MPKRIKGSIWTLEEINQLRRFPKGTTLEAQAIYLDKSPAQVRYKRSRLGMPKAAVEKRSGLKKSEFHDPRHYEIRCIGFRLNEDDYFKFRRLCVAKNKTMSQILTNMVIGYINANFKKEFPDVD